MHKKSSDPPFILPVLGMLATAVVMVTVVPFFVEDRGAPIQVTIDPTDFVPNPNSNLTPPVPHLTVQCVTESSLRDNPDLKNAYEGPRTLQDLELELLVNEAYENFLESHLDDCRQSLNEKCDCGDYSGMQP